MIMMPLTEAATASESVSESDHDDVFFTEYSSTRIRRAESRVRHVRHHDDASDATATESHGII